MKVASLLALLVAVACHGGESARSPGAEHDACAIGTRATRPCAPPFTCKLLQVPRRAAGAGDDSFLSDDGGPCGGVAGFHCADGLVCDLPEDQSMMSDGMGQCARSSVCAR